MLVMKNGAVQNRFLHVTVTEAELQRIHNLLDDVVEGRTLGDLRELFARRLQSERVQHDELRRTAFELGGAAIEQAAGAETRIWSSRGRTGCSRSPSSTTRATCDGW